MHILRLGLFMGMPLIAGLATGQDTGVPSLAKWCGLLASKNLYLEGKVDVGFGPHLLYSSACKSWISGAKFRHDVATETFLEEGKSKIDDRIIASDGEQTYLIKSKKGFLFKGVRQDQGLEMHESPFGIFHVGLGLSRAMEMRGFGALNSLLVNDISKSNLAGLKATEDASGFHLNSATLPIDPSKPGLPVEFVLDKSTGMPSQGIYVDGQRNEQKQQWKVTKTEQVRINGQSISFPSEIVITVINYPKSPPPTVTWRLKKIDTLEKVDPSVFAPDPRKYGVTRIFDYETDRYYPLGK